MRLYRIRTSAMQQVQCDMLIFFQLKFQIHSRFATLHLSISVHLAQEIEGSQTEMNTLM